ncbi:MAG: ribosome biogenesis GTP-binding protein YihA/YsxC [Gammaproteobacteria bacterium]|nr:ribosome biogenesis GTP-binding protein YihA/YsxC [Gammaproteobacteria bacterium]
MNKPHYNQATFLLSAPSMAELPSDTGIEVAFIGRSNAGKSSAMNTITGIKGLARTSKTPGRTQTMNLFGLDEKRRLVDLPGYGYAKVPLAVKQRWQKVLHEYLERRVSLAGLVLVMDIRHPLKETDQQYIEWATIAEVPVHILLTKSDKLSRGAALDTLQQVRNALQRYGELVSTQLFSAHDRTGLDEAILQLDNWFMQESPLG